MHSFFFEKYHNYRIKQYRKTNLVVVEVTGVGLVGHQVIVVCCQLGGLELELSVQVGQVVDGVLGGRLGNGWPSLPSGWGVIVGGSGVIGSSGFLQSLCDGAGVNNRPS